MWTRIRYRWRQSLAVAALAALVTASTLVGPLYDRAIQQATVATRLADTSIRATGLVVTSPSSDNTPPVPVEGLRLLLPKAVRAAYQKPIEAVTAPVGRWPLRQDSPSGPLFWRSGICSHLTFVSGTCPVNANEIAVSRADSVNFGFKTGRPLPLAETFQEKGLIDPKADHLEARVVGIYTADPKDPYWFGAPPVGRSGKATGSPLSQDSAGVPVDGFVTTRETAEGNGGGPQWKQVVEELDLPIDKSAVDVDTIGPLNREMQKFLREPMPPPEGDSGLYDQTDARSVQAVSGIGDVAEAAAQGRDQARVTVPLLMLQLGLLTVVVLSLVLAAATEQRRPEVALVRLRGRGVSGARRMLLAELGTVALAGAVVGGILALGLSWLTRHAFLPLTPPFELGSGFALACLGVLVALGLVVGVAAQQVVRQPVAALLRRVPARRTTWALGALDATLVAVCATAVVAFATGGLSGPIALAAPALLTLLVGVVLSYLIVPAAAAIGRALLARGHLTSGLSALHIARRPATRRLVAIVAVASGLLVFATDAQAVGARNRELAADQQIGAPMVANLSSADLVAVRKALAEADPSGRDATPVVRIDPPNSAGTSMQAVVPDQFRRIALFPGQSTNDIPWERLDPPKLAPIKVRGTSLTLRFESRIFGKKLPPPDEQVRVSLRLLDSDRLARVQELATIGSRARVRRVLHLYVPCAKGCTIAGLSVDGDLRRAVLGQVTVTLPGGSGRPAISLGGRGDWAGSTTSTGGYLRTQPTDRPDALSVSFNSGGGELLALTHKSSPRQLPALVSGALPAGSSGNHFAAPGLDGVDRSLVRTARLPRVPAAPARTALVNLDVLQRDGLTAAGTDDVRVWFARDDPVLLAKVSRALRSNGVTIIDTITAADARQLLDRSAAAWSLSLAFVVGIASLLVAALVLVVVATTTWRVRGRDFAAMRMAGLSRTRVSLAAVGEQVPVVVVAVLAGTVCGVIGAHLALSSVPLFASAPAVSTLDLSTSWPAVLLSGAAALVVLSALAWAVAVSLAVRATVGRVRESV